MVQHLGPARCPFDQKSLRTTFGTHLALAGVDFRVAVKMMRHKDPRLTMNVYTDPVLLDMKNAANMLASNMCAGCDEESRGSKRA